MLYCQISLKSFHFLFLNIDMLCFYIDCWYHPLCTDIHIFMCEVDSWASLECCSAPVVLMKLRILLSMF